MGQLPYFFLCFGTPDNTFEYQTVDGIVDVRFRFNGGEQRMQQTPPVDEAPAGLGFVYSGYEVGGTVGLPEFDVVAHALHVHRKLDGFLCKLVQDFAFVIRLIRIFVKRNELRPMTIFDDYIRNKGCCKVSKTLLWDYDLTQFDWQRSRKVVVQRIIERGWLRDYFAAFDLYGGIEGFREIIKEVPTLSAQDMNFVCTAFGLKKEELRCYTRRQLRRRHLGC